MRIDVHAHVWSDAYLDLLVKHGNTRTQGHRGHGGGASEVELAARFAQMDKAGVELQVLSITPASPHFEDEATAVEVARFVNDEYAALVRRHPARFRAFAALPLPHIEASLAELARAIDQLGMVGACITTSVLGRSIADEHFHPLYAELNRRELPLYVHPEGCGAHTPLIGEHRMTWSVGAPIEDTVAAMHLILAGTPSRFPRMKIILSHLGGALPMLMQRIDHQAPWESPDTPELPSRAAKRMWYDTVGHNHPPALRAAADTFGADRLLLGSDFPYQSGPLFQAAVDYIENSGLSDRDKRGILDKNAARVLAME